jgi:hypothetical protein
MIAVMISGRAMNKRSFRRRIFLFAPLLALAACKEDTPAGPLYTLTVVTTDGVAGTPQRGTVSGHQGESISYDFTLRAGFKDLAVVIDGVQGPPAGTLIMDRDHALYAEADSIRVVTAAQTASIAATRSLLTATDPIAAATGLLNSMYAAETGSAVAAAMERMKIGALSFNRVTDSAALARLDAALANRLFALDFPSAQGTAPRVAAAADGPLPISIFWVNGIMNTPDEALSGSITAKRMIEEIGLPSYGWPRYETSLNYVPTTTERGLENAACLFLEGGNAISRNLPIIGWFNSVVREKCGNVLDVNRALVDMGNLLVGSFGTSSADVLAARIDSARRRGRGVLLLGHSRGTLVSQLALQQFVAANTAIDSDRQKCVGFVSLASPRPPQVQLRNMRNLWAEGALTRDLMLMLPTIGSPRPTGFRTNLSDKTDQEYAMANWLIQGWAGIRSGKTLHEAITSYLIDAVMRDSVKREIGRQVARIQTECLPQALALAITTQASAGISGDVLNPQPVVQIRDRDGFTVGSSSAAVTASLVGSGGTLSGTRTISATNGIALFPDLRISGSGTFRLSFATAGLPTVTSTAFTIAPATCSGIPVTIPFSRSGSITSASCLVNNRRAQSYRFDASSQGVKVLSAGASAFSPFIKVTETSGRGNYTIWTTGNDLNLRWLLGQGSYVASVGTNSGQNGSFSFTGSTASEDAGTCAITYVLQPASIKTDQRLGAGDCVNDGRTVDVFSLASASGCAVTVQSPNFSPVVEIYARDGSRVAIGSAGTSSQTRVALPNCYAGSDSEFVFGLHAYVFASDQSRSGAYTITFEFSALSGASIAGKPVLLFGGGNTSSLIDRR